MWLIEREGKSVDEVIERICKELGRDREELEFEVEEKEGFLGVFGKKVVVRARPRVPKDWELAVLAEELAEKILFWTYPELKVKAMAERSGFLLKVEAEPSAPRPRRDVLEAMRYLVELALSKKARGKRPVRLKFSKKRHVSRETEGVDRE